MSARAWRGFSGKTPTPLWGAGCSSEGRKQTLVTVNVSAHGKTLLAGCVLGTNMFLVVHCLEISTWVAPKLLSLFTRGSEHHFLILGLQMEVYWIMFHLSTLGLTRNFSMSSTPADITAINAHLYSYEYLERWFSWVATQMTKRNSPWKKFTNFFICQPYPQYLSLEVSRIRLLIFKYRFLYLLGILSSNATTL